MGVKGLKCMLLWDSARLFAAMACIKSGLSSTEKLKSNETLNLPSGNLVRPFLVEFHRFVLCDLRYK